MSLINDALRRARQTHPQGASPAVTPPLRPVETAPRPGRSSLLTLPFMGAVVLLLAGIMLWGWSRAGKTADLKVRANSRTPGDAVSAPEPAVTPSPPTPASVAATTPAPVTGILSTNAMTAQPGANGVNLAESPRPEPPGYKLQGIFYKRNNPSAAINGRTVFVGSRVGDAKVTAITLESVTIVTGAGPTNVLYIGD